MKTFVLVLLLSSIIVAPILAAGAGNRTELNKTAIVENLTKGVNSDNEGLRVSSAFVIKQVIDNSLIEPGEFSVALIPLLKMLDKGTTDKERITAAVTLYCIGDGIGIYRLRGAAKFDNSEKVRKISKNLYYSYHTINNSTYFLDF